MPADNKFPAFLKRGKGKGKRKGGITAAQQAEALRMDDKFDKKKGR